MWEYMERAEDCADEIDKIYDEAYKYLKGESNKIFTRVKDRYNLSDKEAEKILNKSKSLDIKDVKKELKKGIPTEEKTKLLAEIESPAYAFRLKRFERMQDNIDDLMTNVYKREKKASTKHYTELAKESYDKSNYDIQQRLNKGFEVPRLNEKKIDKLLKSKWSGENYSKRIWGRTQDVADKLKREMVVSLMTGKTNREVAKSIEERFGSTSYQARRLVRTESCYIANQTEIMSYKDSGIDKYEYCATLDLRTSPQCQKLDGKVFNVDDAQAGVNLPPMHPFCRSTTLAYFDDDIEDEVNEELGEATETRRAYIPEKGNSELIENMSYEEWKKRYVVDEKSEKGIENKNNSDIIKVPRVDIRTKEPLKEYTVEEINDIAKQTAEIADKYTDRKSKWSGNIVINDKGISGKLWNCDITTPLLTTPHILLHEHLHAHSISYYDYNTYIKNEGIEEATVQFFAQEISKIENIIIESSKYDDLVEGLKIINKVLNSGLVSDFDFAKKLFEINVNDRIGWLYENIRTKSIELNLSIKKSTELYKYIQDIESWCRNE
jgi:SPP1 gp7 family putative phage head morphogenesis protein